MKKTILLFMATILLHTTWAQEHEKCGTVEAWNRLKAKDPEAQLRMQQIEQFTKTFIAENPQQNYKLGNAGNASRGHRSIQISIPVVVHVLYHGEPYGTGPNITDEQIYSQMDALNADYQLLNPDSVPTSSPFWDYSVDCQIQFCLAQQDPQGHPTTGIVRVNSSVAVWSENDFYGDVMKYTSQGGDDNWDPLHYLNFWTFRLDSTSLLLGKGTFPSELAAHPDVDGLLCRYNAFGTVGADLPTTNALGRTMTHEVGHWLNLKHIWGDDSPVALQNGVCDAGECDGTDECADTPPACEPNYRCTQTVPWNANNPCGSDANGEMFMNFMDYGDDPCIVMFTFNQAERMYATLNGPRSAMASSNGCQAPTGIANLNAENNLSVYPNPSRGNFNIRFKHTAGETLSQLYVKNDLGVTVAKVEPNSTDNYQFNLAYLPDGVYFLQALVNGKTISKKLILTK